MLALAGLVVASRIAGNRLTRAWPWPLMTVGMATMVLALLALTLTAPLVDIPVLGVLLFLYGLGGGLFQPANIAAVMAAASAGRQGTISAAQRLVLNIGIGLGTTVSSVVLPLLVAGATAWGVATALSAYGTASMVLVGRHARLAEVHRILRWPTRKSA